MTLFFDWPIEALGDPHDFGTTPLAWSISRSRLLQRCHKRFQLRYGRYCENDSMNEELLRQRRLRSATEFVQRLAMRTLRRTILSGVEEWQKQWRYSLRRECALSLTACRHKWGDTAWEAKREEAVVEALKCQIDTWSGCFNEASVYWPEVWPAAEFVSMLSPLNFALDQVEIWLPTLFIRRNGGELWLYDLSINTEEEWRIKEALYAFYALFYASSEPEFLKIITLDGVHQKWDGINFSLIRQEVAREAELARRIIDEGVTMYETPACCDDCPMIKICSDS